MYNNCIINITSASDWTDLLDFDLITSDWTDLLDVDLITTD